MPNPEVLPPMDIAQAEVAATAKKAMTNVSDARRKLSEIMQGGPPKKSDLQAVVALLEGAEREAVANLPFVVERGQEALNDQKTKAKGEVRDGQAR